jgi:flavin-dependent dehydrogenase
MPVNLERRQFDQWMNGTADEAAELIAASFRKSRPEIDHDPRVRDHDRHHHADGSPP